MTTAGVIRIILVVDIIMMSLLAVFYLRQRKMSFASYCWWSCVALLVPILGPFLVISNRPGSWNPDVNIQRDLRRAAAFLLGLFSEQVGRNFASGRLRARTRLRSQANSEKTRE
jgi:hypothetical protein